MSFKIEKKKKLVQNYNLEDASKIKLSTVT